MFSAQQQFLANTSQPMVDPSVYDRDQDRFGVIEMQNLIL